MKLLDLEPIEVNLFRGVSPDEERQRVFGGQVAGQALVAAARTVEPGRAVHSLHAYFLRPGDPTVPILYEVDRIRDGRSFTTRRVVAIQHGKAIFNLQSSFQVPEEGLEHEAPMPEVPRPETLPDFTDPHGALRRGDGAVVPPTPTDRHPPRRLATRPTARSPCRPTSRCGCEPTARCPTTRAARLRAHLRERHDAARHHAAARTAGSWDDEDLFMASLDHAMWFHRPFRADGWLLYDQDTPSASGGRGLGRGNIFTADGHLAVTAHDRERSEGSSSCEGRSGDRGRLG